MLFNVSYTNPEISAEIDSIVGKPFPFLKRVTMGTIGSQRFELSSGNEELKRVVLQTANTPFCNIGLRPKGIKIWFSVKLHTYLLALPFKGLEITAYDNSLRLNGPDWWLEMIPAHRAKLNRGFIRKMKGLQQKSNPDRT